MPGSASHAPEDAPFEHLDSLHRLAQAVAPSAEQAARLVAATYRHAAALPVSERRPLHDRLWLLRLMMQIQHEENYGLDDPSRESPLSAPATGTPSFSDFRRRAAEQLLSQKLPAIFAGLPAQERALLILCGVERFSCADGGAVLGLSVEAACAALDRAWTHLRQELRASVGEAERRLLDEALPTDGYRTALQQLASSGFAAPPSALKSAVAATVRRQPPAHAPKKEGRALPTPTRASSSRRPASRFRLPQRLQRSLVTLLIIGVAGFVGYFASALLQTAPTTDLIALSAAQADGTRTALPTGNTEEAERFIREQLGQRLTIPTVEEASLQGVSIVEVTPGVRVPVLRFADASGGSIVLYAYTYALLDRHGDRLHLDTEVLQRLEDDGRVVSYNRDDRAVLLWRDRDDIFVAVAPGDASALRRRLSS